MSHRVPLALGLSLLATATLSAQTYTWNPASTGAQTWDTNATNPPVNFVWSTTGPGGSFDKVFVSGAASSAYLS